MSDTKQNKHVTLTARIQIFSIIICLPIMFLISGVPIPNSEGQTWCTDTGRIFFLCLSTRCKRYCFCSSFLVRDELYLCVTASVQWPSLQSAGRTRSSSRHPSSTTRIFLITNHQPLFHICITLPVESTPFFIPSTSFCSLSSWFTSSCTYHLITVTAFALTICHCLYLSLQTSQILSSIGTLIPSGLPSQILTCTE